VYSKALGSVGCDNSDKLLGVEHGVDCQNAESLVDVTESGNSKTPCSLSCNIVNSEMRVDEAVLLGGPAGIAHLLSLAFEVATVFQAPRASFAEKHIIAGAVLTVRSGESGGVLLKLPKSMNVLCTGISSLRGGQATASTSECLRMIASSS
jgi:hypothetical protein